MAKAKPPASDLVETVQDNDFGEAEPERLAPIGQDRGSEIEAIRAARAAQRLVKGKAGKKRVITNYHDAERLRNLKMLTPEEEVDCEEAGLFPDPAHYATGTSAAIDPAPKDDV